MRTFLKFSVLLLAVVVELSFAVGYVETSGGIVTNLFNYTTFLKKGGN